MENGKRIIVKFKIFNKRFPKPISETKDKDLWEILNKHKPDLFYQYDIHAFSKETLQEALLSFQKEAEKQRREQILKTQTDSQAFLRQYLIGETPSYTIKYK